ncbi:MAG: GlcNAc-PI de-N-acetylase [Planctomycetota bacterium]|nr:MAG: GlcNAc-PI de-N-acetylase [Planctomycetota bacterium]
MNILIIAAHPDDEVLGCGGVMAKLSSEGHDVHVLILGEGVTARKNLNDEQKITKLSELHDQSKKASDLLGVNSVRFENFPDNQFDTVSLLSITQKIESVLNDIQPSMVFCQHGGDLNIDHQITFKATLTATRPMMGSVVNKLLAYEVMSSTEWAFQQFEPSFKPNCFYDIENVIDKKIEAMKIYKDELCDFPHPRSVENLLASSKRWGSNIGCQNAEAFQIIFERN